MATATDPADIALGLRYGLPVQQAAQRSQYLAAALQNLQAQSSAPKSYGETALRLLADGILQSKRTGTDQALISALQGQRQSMAADALSGLPDGSAPQSAPSAPPLASSVSAPPVDAPQATPTPSAPAAALGAALSGTAPRGLRNNNPLNVTSLPKGQQWNGQTGSDGTYAQFATPQDGWNAADKNLANYGKLHGINTEAGVINRWAPGAQAEPYIQTVSGQTGIAPNAPIDLSNPQVRQTLLTGMAGVENGQPVQFGQGMQPGQPQPSPAAMMQPQPLPSGVAPPPLAPPPAAPPQQAAGGASAPQGVPHNYIDPKQVQLAKDMMSRGETYEQGLALAYKLREQAAGNPDPSKPYYTPDGKIVYPRGTPTDSEAHFDASTGQTYYTPKDPGGAPASTLAAPAGFKAPLTGNLTYGADGKAAPIPGTGTTVSGQYQPNTVVATDVSGKPSVVQAPPYTTESLLSQRKAFKDSDTYKQHVNTASAVNSLQDILKAATGNNGIVDMSAFDNLIRAQTGLSARQGNMSMMMSHLGFPAEAAGLVSNIAGSGFTTPEQIRNALSALRGYATTHQTIAQHELDQDAALAKAQGFDFGVTLPPINPVPDVPWLGLGGSSLAPKQPNGTPAFSDIDAKIAAAAAAEIARRRAAGTMK